MTVPQKLSAVRAALQSQGWAAFVVAGTDPHDTEYLQTCDGTRRWETRAWITGFTGSAGTVVITADHAGLWTDGRYFTQAEEELAGSGIELFRDGLPQTPSPAAWLSANLPRGSKVGFDARTVTVTQLNQWRAGTAVAGLIVDAGADVFETAWSPRPGFPSAPVWDYEGAVDGLVSRRDKATAVRQGLAKAGAEACVVTALDDVAWLFNLRGSDVDYLPVFLGWGWVDAERFILFAQEECLEIAVRQALQKAMVELRPYASFEAELANLSAGRRVLLPPDRTNALIHKIVSAAATVVEAPSPLTLLKARKTPAELALIAEAHRRDGIALVEFLTWFEAHAPGGTLTETGAAEALDEQRKQRGGYRSPSFPAIPGFGPNAAIIHYHAHGAGAPIRGRGLFLLDTGAQYTQGTTDVTRTMVIGEPTAEERDDYTTVLKAHVQVSLTPFPVGTNGFTVDAFARQALWKTGRHYNHGTGHGVGQFLSAHEGPARLRLDPTAVALEPGMVLSNEPGVYRPGKHGVRIENLVTVVPAQRTEFASFLRWETLTLCPYERRLIDVTLLTTEERQWIDAYHQRVLRELGSAVSAPAREWLKAACLPL